MYQALLELFIDLALQTRDKEWFMELSAIAAAKAKYKEGRVTQ